MPIDFAKVFWRTPVRYIVSFKFGYKLRSTSSACESFTRRTAKVVPGDVFKIHGTEINCHRALVIPVEIYFTPR